MYSVIETTSSKLAYYKGCIIAVPQNYHNMWDCLRLNIPAFQPYILGYTLLLSQPKFYLTYSDIQELKITDTLRFILKYTKSSVLYYLLYIVKCISIKGNTTNYYPQLIGTSMLVWTMKQLERVKCKNSPKLNKRWRQPHLNATQNYTI